MSSPKSTSLPVDTRPDIAGPPHLEKFFAVFAFSAADDRREDLKLAAFRQRADGIHHLLHGLRGDFLAALEAVGSPDAREQQAQIIVNFRDGADGRARIVAGALLLDGDGRREPFDRIDIGLPHLFEELTGIGGQRFDVPALSFRIDRVEGERRFAGPAQAGDDDQLVARNLDVDVLEIVLARAFDDDGVTHERQDYSIRPGSP